ncbi:FUSC family protein [Alteromonas ponticola]|uniref:FUSC family protein n=1 Tax=Alteromonas aquimaris TaxID=2998417 RepID=A0ABT3P5V7_9ALTE|nr:FUSC family protein [Alteromonas aquimaris]MCW8108144.1 FUSC family protein [Alteromonas aquimaris]
MTLSPLQATYLTPDRATLTFALKGVIAMALALYIAMFLNLEHPYWAMVSAVFLQTRPESGMVLEKALCQIGGTLIGGVVGLVILQHFHASPLPALSSLALWVGINSTLSSMVRRVNFIYLFAMACVTPCIIILLVMAQPETVTSAAIFQIAQARTSEIIVGALCAMLVSFLLWPRRVLDGLFTQAQTVINQTMEYLSLELDPAGSHEARHERIDKILETLAMLNDDASAVVYEGPDGPGRSRAAIVISNRVLSLVATIQIFGRLQRNNPELVTGVLAELIDGLREAFTTISESEDFERCYNTAQAQRRKLLKFVNETTDVPPLELRLLRAAQEMVSDLVVVLRAFNAMKQGKDSLLKASSQLPYRDPLIGLTTGFRSFLVFSIGALLWTGTGSPAAIMLMILPVIYSIMFARLPPEGVREALWKVLIGVFIAIPVAIFFALGLLAQSSGDFEMLILVLAGPFFLGLMAISKQESLPYGIGFCIPFAVLVRPGNDMSSSFQVDFTLSNAFAIVVGVTVLYWVFKLFTGPGVSRVQWRLLNAMRRDIRRVGRHRSAKDWFNARMGDRLLRIANYEKGVKSEKRVVTDLGLTALNLGHSSLRLRALIRGAIDDEMLPLLDNWQEALATAFYNAAKGQTSPAFESACVKVLEELGTDENAAQYLPLIEGMFARMTITFERTAKMVVDARDK